MKRTWFAGSILAAALLAFGQAPAAAQAKLGYIDTQRVMAQAPGMAQARQTLESELTRYRTELDSVGAQLEKMHADLQRQQATLSATVRQQREADIQTRTQAAQQRYAELQNTAQQREQQLMEPILKRVNDAVEAVRKEGGYAMIFETGSFIAADPTLDLTTRVLTKLGVTAPK
jgi:outer membrane protein